MNYRPYPDVNRALAQLARGHATDPLPAWIGEVIAPLKLTEFQREWLNASIAVNHPKRTGRSTITAALADQAVKAGEHVHVAGRDGMRCAGEDDACSLPRIARGDQVAVHHDGQSSQHEVTDIPVPGPDSGQPSGFQLTLRKLTESMPSSGAFAANATAFSRSIARAGVAAETALAQAAAAGPPRCPGCGHAQHAPGTECDASVDHGPNRWHRCLCLATPGASRACPAQMDCQGGPLRYADIWHLRQGRSLRGADGATITPDVLAEDRA